jgi:hypothetical protein
MSEVPPPPRNGNGNGRKDGHLLVAISDRLIRVLPPAFLLLIVINILFLGTLLWVVNHNLDARNVMLTRIVDRCLQTPPPAR